MRAQNKFNFDYKKWNPQMGLGHRGASLIELWLAVVLLVFVGAGAYGLLDSGIDFYRRRQVIGRLVEAAMLLDALERDAANAVVVSEWPNRGRTDFVRFTTLVAIPPSEGFRARQNGPWPGGVEYAFDKKHHRFVRRVYDYGAVTGAQRSKQIRQSYVEGVRTARFEFFHHRKAAGEWTPIKGFTNGLPCLMRVSLELTWPGKSALNTKLQRWIVFPTGPW